MNFDAEWIVTGTRLGLSIILGGIIGIEREIHGKSAGLRTHMLVALGAALFTVLSYSLPLGNDGENAAVADPTRIAAQIVAGVGFLGAGAILRARGAVHGLTTAASIWVVAAIGMAAGGGFYRGALLATLLGHLVLVGIYHIEQSTIRRRAVRQRIRVAFEGEQDFLWVTGLFREIGIRRVRWDVRQEADQLVLRIDGIYGQKELDALLDRLHGRGTVKALRVGRF